MENMSQFKSTIITKLNRIWKTWIFITSIRCETGSVLDHDWQVNLRLDSPPASILNDMLIRMTKKNWIRFLMSHFFAHYTSEPATIRIRPGSGGRPVLNPLQVWYRSMFISWSRLVVTKNIHPHNIIIDFCLVSLSGKLLFISFLVFY